MHQPRSDDAGVDPFGLALDEVLRAWSEGRELRRDELAALYPLLGGAVDEVLDLAREIAVLRPTPAPRIPGFDVLGEVGRGGMGVVYRARQHGIDRVVALKMLPEALGVDARGRSRFLAEARGLGRVRHPHVVTIHGVVETADVVAYAMEWVDGRSLASVLEELAGWPRRGARPMLRFGGDGSAALPDPAVPWFCRLGIAIARALGEMHRHGLVHRDVKPGNVLLRSDGTALLSDFGLVRAEQLGLTRTGQVVGTPAFAAPEQLRSDPDSVGARSDVWGLGATLHCALAGQVPFAGRTPIELLANSELRRRRSLVACGMPRDLETIVARCLEPDARDRYASADAVADDLENLLAMRPVSARPLGRGARAWRLLRRNRRIVLASAVSGVVMLAVCVLLGLWIWDLVTLPARFEEKLLAARFALLEPTHEERVELAKVGKPPERPSAFETSGEQALAAYDAALSLDATRSDVAMERDVVALAQSLLRKVEPKISEALRTAAPPVCAAATAWHEGCELELASFGEASTQQRRALGLLAFLTGHVDVCHEAWRDLELAGDTFIDAAAGQMHLQRGEIPIAMALLARAAQTWDHAGFLAVALADCAVRSGNLDLAERELGRAATLGLQDPFETTDRVRADLLAARGDDAGALTLYEQHLRRHTGAAVRISYGRLLHRTGQTERAIGMMLSAWEAPVAADPARAEDLLDVAATWWWELSATERRLHCAAVLTGNPGTLARLVHAWKNTRPESRTPFESPSSAEEGWSISDQLHFLEDLAVIPAVPNFASRVHPFVLRATQQLLEQQSDPISSDKAPKIRWIRSLALRAIAITTILLTADAGAQVVWTAHTGPSPRRAPSSAWDESNGVVLTTGGHSGTTYYNEHWEWNGLTWTSRGNAPFAPRSHSALARAQGGGVILFGGYSGTGGLGDTWLWNGVAWTQHPPSAPSPSLRWAHTMAWDSNRNVAVLFGGTQASQTPLGDTWEWNGTGWNQRFPTTTPGPLYGHCSCFDPVSNMTLVCSGASSPSSFNHLLWGWDGTSWTQLSNSAPDRYLATFTWDTERDCALLWGGADSNSGAPNTTVEWDGSTWVTRTPSISVATPLVGRDGVSSAFDPIRRVTKVVGGITAGASATRSWTYGPVAPGATTVSGPGCNPAASVLPTLQRVPGTGPWIGRPLRLQASGLPPLPSSNWMFLDLADPATPLPGGCTLHAGPMIADLLPTGSVAYWPVQGPFNVATNPALYGFQFTAQAVALDFNLPAPWVAALSNGLHLQIGSR